MEPHQADATAGQLGIARNCQSISHLACKPSAGSGRRIRVKRGELLTVVGAGVIGRVRVRARRVGRLSGIRAWPLSTQLAFAQRITKRVGL